MSLPGHSDPCLCAACDHSHHRHASAIPLLSLIDVGFRREERRILNDVNMRVDHGDFIAITGPNGGGKTTLLRIILGLLKPDSGKVVFYNDKGELSDSRPSIGYLPQKNSVDSHFPISVREVVASGLLGKQSLSKAEKVQRVAEVLETIEMSALADRPIGRLSGGQLQRALFGRAIIAEPRMLVLDEPLSYLDKHFESHLYKIIAQLASHTSILLVSHEMSQIAGMANRHIIIDGTLRECTATHHYIPGEC